MHKQLIHQQHLTLENFPLRPWMRGRTFRKSVHCSAYFNYQGSISFGSELISRMFCVGNTRLKAGATLFREEQLKSVFFAL